ncbi:MAG: hypothetical protein ACO3ZZ_00855 [Solirubrobacterales bacterium]
MSGPDSRSSLRRRPFAARLVTGPVGRLVGFMLDFAREIGRLGSERLAARASRRARGR